MKKAFQIIKVVFGALLLLGAMNSFSSIFRVSNIGEAFGHLLVDALVLSLGGFLLFSGITNLNKPEPK